jgi:Leucine-rich repeat (LRR) protein
MLWLLGLHGNRLLSGPIPTAPGRLSRLQTLVVGVNTTDRISLHRDWLALQYKGVSVLSRVGTISTELGNLRGLVALDLSNIALSGRVPSEIGSLTGLDALLVSSNHDWDAPHRAGQPSPLASLLVTDNPFTGTIPSQVGL